LNKKQIQSGQTKKKMADAAKALFINKGYKATSIEDIVEVTGNSKGNIYYHFKSKEGLLLYLFDEWDREWEEQWAKKESLYISTTDKLYGIAELLVHEDLNHPLTKVADEFFNHEEITNEVKERSAAMMARHVEFYRNILQQGMDSGEFAAADVNLLAVVLESLIIGLGDVSRNTFRKNDTQQALKLYRRAIEIFLNGVVQKQA
jgi:AcrR family transcriptional regulator